MALKDIVISKRLTELTTSEVRELQELLVNANYTLKIDGILGEKTEWAFKEFKFKNKLTAPYLIGPTTIKYLFKNKTASKPPDLKINLEGLNLIKEFEGFRSKAYLCAANVPTLGYGSTFYPNGIKVKLGDTITLPEAEKLLLVTIEGFAKGVRNAVKVPLTTNQFSALVSFAFNVGLSAFESSTLLKKINNKDYSGASLEFSKWVKGGGKTLPGLVRRRNAEKNLFLKKF
jgi:lysozyme